MNKDGHVHFFPAARHIHGNLGTENSSAPTRDASNGSTLELEGVARRMEELDGVNDYDSQRFLFSLMGDMERGRLFRNVANAMYGIPQPIIDHQLDHLARVDPVYSIGVRAALDAIDDLEDNEAAASPSRLMVSRQER